MGKGLSTRWHTEVDHLRGKSQVEKKNAK